MKKIIIVVILVGIVVGGIFFFWRKNVEKTHVIPEEIIKVKRGNLSVKVLATGTLKPYTKVEIRSPVRGRIDEIKLKEGDKIKKGEIIAWLSSEERIALLDAARASFEEAKNKGDAKAIEEAEEEMRIASLAYKKVPVISPIDGEVIRRSAEPGQNAFSETVLFVLSDRLVAIVEVDEADIRQIKLRQRANILLDAFPDDAQQGKVDQIAREGRLVNNVTVYDVTVSPYYIPRQWAAEMTANVEFLIAEKKNVLIIPIEAVKERDDKKFVFSITSEKPKPVKLGIMDNLNVEVKKGLKEGEEIMIKRGEEEGKSRRKYSMFRMFRRMKKK